MIRTDGCTFFQTRTDASQQSAAADGHENSFDVARGAELIISKAIVP